MKGVLSIVGIFFIVWVFFIGLFDILLFIFFV